MSRSERGGRFFLALSPSNPLNHVVKTVSLELSKSPGSTVRFFVAGDLTGEGDGVSDCDLLLLFLLCVSLFSSFVRSSTLDCSFVTLLSFGVFFFSGMFFFPSSLSLFFCSFSCFSSLSLFVFCFFCCFFFFLRNYFCIWNLIVGVVVIGGSFRRFCLRFYILT